MSRETFNGSVKCALAVLFSPVAEKNRIRALAVQAPYVLSLTAIIVASMAVAIVYRIASHPNIGWPEAIIAVTVILALPILRAIDKAPTQDVMELAKILLSRYGIGEVSKSNMPFEPHQWESGDPDAGVL